jgi:hypothetical protein
VAHAALIALALVWLRSIALAMTEELMSAASPATSQVRRNAAAAPSRSHQQQAPVRQAAHAPQTQAFVEQHDEDEIRLNLSDIPRMEATLDVEAFKPSLLSRLFDLVAPYKR